MKLFKKILILGMIASMASLIACSDDSSPSDSDGEANFRMIVTDAPLPIEFVERADVTFSKIEIKKANENEKNQFVLITDQATTIDLMELRNGVTKELAEKEVDATSYKMIRLTVSYAIIELTDGKEFNLDIPPNWIEITIEPELNVESGTINEVLIDFDLSNSFEVQGDPTKITGVTGFKFDPEIRAVNMTNSGIIEGKVSDSENSDGLYNARVWLEGENESNISTFTEDDGSFKMIGVLEGTYNVHSTKDGYSETTKSNVTVTQGNETSVNFLLNKK